MRIRRAALAVLTFLTMSLLVTTPASAGGPTSVLLVAPGTGRTASLYTGQADYDQLAQLVGAFAPGGSDAGDGPGTEHEQGNAVTLTWLIHDVLVWRVDRVYLDAPGGPWISTQVDTTGEGNLMERPGTWTKVARGKDLAALLDRVGVGQKAGASPSASVSTAPAAPVRAVATATTPPPAPATGGLPWAIGGLAVGVASTLAALGGSRAVRRRARTAQRTPPRTARTS